MVDIGRQAAVATNGVRSRRDQTSCPRSSRSIRIPSRLHAPPCSAVSERDSWRPPTPAGRCRRRAAAPMRGIGSRLSPRLRSMRSSLGLRDYTNKALIVNGSNTQFAYYIAGLIEGDGTIHVPKSERSNKGKLNYPSIQIVFHLKDLPLALLIQKELGHGSISRKKGLNAYIYTVNNIEGVMLLINLLNGKMKTNKIFALHRLID